MKTAQIPLRFVSTNLTHTGAVLKRCITNRYKLFSKYIIGIEGLSSTTFVAFTNTVDVAWTVVMERVFYHIINGQAVEPFRPSEATVLGHLDVAYTAYRKTASFIAAWDFQTFVDSVHGRKKQLYQRAVERVLGGWTWRDVRMWSKIRAFIKFEKLPLENKRLVPRVVQPRSPEYNVLVGRYIKAAEHVVYENLACMCRDDLPVVAKGMNSYTLGDIIAKKWGRYTHPVCVGFDQSRFDQHISKAMLKFEHKFYQLHFHSRELFRLLQEQLQTRATIMCPDGIIKYVSVGRCSGDMNTGCGNTILQCSMMFSFISNQPFTKWPSLMVNGDDSFVICEAEDLHLLRPFSEFCRELGFVLKVEEPVNTLERISFCQMNPVFNGEQYVMMRSFPKCISKDTFTTKNITKETYLPYFAAIGDAGLSLHKGIPVLQAFNQYLISFSNDRVDLNAQDMYGWWNYWTNNLSPKAVEITEEARVSFYNATGVLPEHQIAIEERFLSLPPPLWGNEPILGVFPYAEYGFSGGGSDV